MTPIYRGLQRVPTFIAPRARARKTCNRQTLCNPLYDHRGRPNMTARDRV
jgi:hypothetical protein